jgi:hypothetical protein
MRQLSLLRLLFIIYFLARTAIDLAAGGRISSGLSTYLAPHTYYTIAIVGNVLLFLLGLLVFHFLLVRKNWARIILLVVGWLAVIDFLSSLLLTTAGVEVLRRIDPAVNWDAIIQIDRITDFVGFLFWGCTIFVLQFRADVKKLFLPQPEESKPKENGAD